MDDNGKQPTHQYNQTGEISLDTEDEGHKQPIDLTTPSLDDQVCPTDGQLRRDPQALELGSEFVHDVSTATRHQEEAEPGESSLHFQGVSATQSDSEISAMETHVSNSVVDALSECNETFHLFYCYTPMPFHLVYCLTVLSLCTVYVLDSSIHHCVLPLYPSLLLVSLNRNSRAYCSFRIK